MNILNVLLLEDNPDDAELTIFELEESGLILNLTLVDTREDYIKNLSPDLDIIIADFNLPAFDGLSAFHILKKQNLDIPFIIVSGTIGEEIAVDCIKQGITDYVIKDRLARLPSAINQALEQRDLRRLNNAMLHELHESEERLKAIVNAIPDLVFLIDETGRNVEVITNHPQLLTTQSQTLQGKTLSETLPPDVADIIYQGIQATLDSGEQQVVEYNLDVEIGRRWFESRIATSDIILDGQRTVVLIARDITERKRIQDKLTSLTSATSYLFQGETLQEVGEQVVKAVVNELGQVDCGLMLVDSSRKTMLRLSRAGVYEVDTNEILYLDGQGIVPTAVRTQKLEYVPDVRQDSVYLPNNPLTRSELVVPLLVNSTVIGVLDLQSPELDGFSEEDQQVVTIFAERAASAINTRQLIEQINHHAGELEWRVVKRTADLQRTTERIEVILNSSEDVIILASAEGLIQQANPAFERVFEYHPDRMFNKPLSKLITQQSRDNFEEVMQDLIEQNKMQRLDVTAKISEQSSFFADVVLSPVLNRNQLTGIICSFRDVSARKQLEIELREALQKEKELNELKSRFVSMVSHEYRTPLATILLSTDLLKKYYDKMDQDRKQKHFDKISSQIRHMTRLMEDMLIVSKADAVGLKFEPKLTDVEALLREVVIELGLNHMTHGINFKASGNCSLVQADPKLIHTIVTNLLTNAIKYSPDNTEVDVGLTCDNDNIIINITDRGIGIPIDDQKHLFQIFHRAKNVGTIQGTGLGLIIVKQSVEAHGGTLDFESQENVGTTFIARLPLQTL